MALEKPMSARAQRSTPMDAPRTDLGLAAAGGPKCRLANASSMARVATSSPPGCAASAATAPRRASFPKAGRPGLAMTQPGTRPNPRSFSDADKALMRSLHGFMPHALLLQTLNNRRVADDPRAVPITPAELDAEIRAINATAQRSGGGSDWAMLRRALNAAREAGLLQRITPNIIQDFAGLSVVAAAARAPQGHRGRCERRGR